MSGRVAMRPVTQDQIKQHDSGIRFFQGLPQNVIANGGVDHGMWPAPCELIAAEVDDGVHLCGIGGERCDAGQRCV